MKTNSNGLIKYNYLGDCPSTISQSGRSKEDECFLYFVAVVILGVIVNARDSFGDVERSGAVWYSNFMNNMLFLL